jgi:chromate transport protein ChrA
MSVAVVVVALEAVLVLVAALLAGVATAEGHSYQLSSGIAISIIGVAAAAGLGLVSRGLRHARRWTRTPALMTQLFVGIVGIYLVQGARYEWGVPALVLAVAGFVSLLAPPSTRALTAGMPQPAGRRRRD